MNGLSITSQVYLLSIFTLNLLLISYVFAVIFDYILFMSYLQICTIEWPVHMQHLTRFKLENEHRFLMSR
jgi:hypothetical protein